MAIFPEFPSDLGAAGTRRLKRYIAEAQDIAEKVAADPEAYISEDVTSAQLLDEMSEGVAAIEAAREELARRSKKAVAESEEEGEGEDEGEEEEAPEGEASAESEEFTANLAELATRARAEAEEPAGDEDEGEGEGEEEEEAVTASAEEEKPKRRRLPRPSSERQAVEAELQPLVAAADGLGFNLGEGVDEIEIAKMMINRRRSFGNIAPGTEDKIPIARADWSDQYDADHTLTADADVNWERISKVIDQKEIKRNLDERRSKSLTASGGLCAPVTPYYQLQMVSMADRPVKASLPSFNADRGGLRFARPAALTGVTTAVGIKTEAQDRAGGTTAAKTCQVIPCPAFSEVDVATIYHCLQFGNLGARTFPELVAQWNSLVLAAQARLAETLMLDGIHNASTKVTASNNLMGGSASIPGQILVAADAMRSRHRMNTDAVLRCLLPNWLPDLMVSDVIRGQFARFDTNRDRITALLRSFNIEPTYYIDSASGGGQVFGAQGTTSLLAFPSTAIWYLFPEGSFLYLDGGVLELGLVRDSVLNTTNDFQIFGESFENVAFIGVESIAVSSTVCDSGTVALPQTGECPQTY